MPDLLSIIIPLLLFALLALTFVRVLRSAAALVAWTREMEGFRRTADDLATRTAATLGGACERIDAVRRGAAAPAAVREVVDAARQAMGRYRAESEALVAPDGYGSFHAGLAEALDRAGRALETVDGGCAIHTAAGSGGGSEAEGLTAIKRGYLDLLHAREAVIEVGTSLRAARPSPPQPPWFRNRPAD